MRLIMKKKSSLQELTPDATLSQISSADKEAAHLLASIGLDPSNHEGETLRSACKQRQWSEVEVLQWIKKQRLSDGRKPGNDPQPEEPDFGDDTLRWCTYLEEKFHAKNLRLLDELTNDFPKVKQLHGNQYPWLKNMQWHFEKLSGDLQLYLKFERMKFFPLIEKIENNSHPILEGTISKLQRSLDIIEKDQKRLLELMNTVREKGQNFENPKGACSTLRILNYNFKDLESSLQRQFVKEREEILPLVRQKLTKV